MGPKELPLSETIRGKCLLDFDIDAAKGLDEDAVLVGPRVAEVEEVLAGTPPADPRPRELARRSWPTAEAEHQPTEGSHTWRGAASAGGPQPVELDKEDEADGTPAAAGAVGVAHVGNTPSITEILGRPERAGPGSSMS